MRMRRLLIVAMLIAVAAPALAQTKEARGKYDAGVREVEHRNGPKAEKLLREAIELAPDWMKPRLALGEMLTLQRRWEAAAEVWARARELDDKNKSDETKKLPRPERNSLLDSLGVAQGQAGQLDAAIATYTAALKEDPDYALFEYNLACSFAEKGDLDRALTHLKRSWTLRDNIPSGQRFPDPRKDDSFRRYWNDPRFLDVVENMVI